MTKESVPVCGAPTRAGTSCQNTLVTGCGRCPVHASQLRAAQSGTKPSTRARRKKPTRRHSPLVQTRNASNAMAAALEAASASLNDADIIHTPVPSHRTMLTAGMDNAPHPPAIPFPDALTPLQQYASTHDFHTPAQQQALALNEVASLNHALKCEKEPLCSPVTPTTPETNRLDMYGGEGALGDDAAPTDDDVLQGQSVAYLGVDLTNMDIPIPKMSFNFM